MSSRLAKSLFLILVLAAAVFFIVQQAGKKPAGGVAVAGKKTAVIAYQTGIDPAKTAQAAGLYGQTAGYLPEWRKFDSGTDVIAALASGDAVIGNIGSSPLASAAAKNLPFEVFYIAAVLGQSEALVTRNTIQKPEDLAGRKIAVPFVSTTHYSFLSALRHWGIEEKAVEIINLRPPEIAAAWARGDIDGAYVWEPVLGKLQKDGRVLAGSADLAQWGAPTYDIWIVRKDFARQNPEFLRQFVKVSAQAVKTYNDNPQAFIENAGNIQAIAGLTGSDIDDIPRLLAGNLYPDLNGQKKLLSGSFSDDIKNTAAFLKSQGKIDTVHDSYAGFINTEFIEQVQQEK